MIIHVSSSQCLVKSKAPFIPFPAVQLGCQWRPHPLIRHQCFLRSEESRDKSIKLPAEGFSTSASSKAHTTCWAPLENGRKQFTGNTGNPILSQRAHTHAAATVSSPPVFPSISPENSAIKVKKATMELRRLMNIALILLLHWKGVFTLTRKK